MRRSIKFYKKWGDRYQAEALVSKIFFRRRVVFDSNLAVIESAKEKIELKKQIYIGFNILELSKNCLYDFHYNYILPEFYINNVKLMYTDTDSLIYEFKDKDIYEIVKRDSHKFDTSDYPLDNQYGIKQLNKKKPGLMKDEGNSTPIDSRV